MSEEKKALQILQDNYQEDNINEYKELLFNVSFKNQVNKHGLYKIREIDYVGHDTFYYVFLVLF